MLGVGWLQVVQLKEKTEPCRGGGYVGGALFLRNVSRLSTIRSFIRYQPAIGLFIALVFPENPCRNVIATALLEETTSISSTFD